MDGMAPEVIYVVSFSISNRYVTITGQLNAFIAIFHVLWISGQAQVQPDIGPKYLRYEKNTEWSLKPDKFLIICRKK